MIEFNVDRARATKERFGALSQSVDRQYSSAESAYRTTKSALLEKIRTTEAYISTANSERAQAEQVLAHNREIEQKTRAQVNEAKAKCEALKKSKSDAERDLGRVQARIGFVRAMTDGKSSSALSLLEAKASRLSSSIRSYERDITKAEGVIADGEKKLEAIARANSRLTQIIESISRDISRLQAACKQMNALKGKMMQSKEAYDGRYGATKRGMQLVHERTARALEAGYKALSYFGEAGCGSSKTICVDSPSVIMGLSMNIDRSAGRLSGVAFELEREAGRYGSRLRDKISAQAIAESAKANTVCTAHSREWEGTARAFKNAAYQLTFYLETKL